MTSRSPSPRYIAFACLMVLTSLVSTFALGGTAFGAPPKTVHKLGVHKNAAQGEMKHQLCQIRVM